MDGHEQKKKSKSFFPNWNLFIYYYYFFFWGGGGGGRERGEGDGERYTRSTCGISIFLSTYVFSK